MKNTIGFLDTKERMKRWWTLLHGTWDSLRSTDTCLGNSFEDSLRTPWHSWDAFFPTRLADTFFEALVWQTFVRHMFGAYSCRGFLDQFEDTGGDILTCRTESALGGNFVVRVFRAPSWDQTLVGHSQKNFPLVGCHGKTLLADTLGINSCEKLTLGRQSGTAFLEGIS